MPTTPPTTAPNIALATCEEHPGFIAGDDTPLVDAFREAGCGCDLVRWDEKDADWSAFDAVVIRSTWDYQDRLDEYLEWVKRVDGESLLLNPAATIEANIRKTYLKDLESKGVPIVPTAWFETGTDLRSRIEAQGWAECIAKPAIGAGASGLKRFSASDVASIKPIARHIDECAAAGIGPVLVQPWLPTILDRGETSVVMIAGKVSHAVRKVPSGGDFRVQIEFGGEYTVVEPTDAQRDVALAAHDAANDPANPLLYARVDLVEPEPDIPAVIELELIEPELFFPLVSDAPHRFAAKTLDRVAANQHR